jgi:hypothetical protein
MNINHTIQCIPGTAPQSPPTGAAGRAVGGTSAAPHSVPHVSAAGPPYPATAVYSGATGASSSSSSFASSGSL